MNLDLDRKPAFDKNEPARASSTARGEDVRSELSDVLQEGPRRALFAKMYVKNLAVLAVNGVSVSLDRILGSRANGAFGILTYHRMAPPVKRVPAPLYNVHPERFEAQMTGLYRCGFRAMPLSEIIDTLRGGRTLPPKTFAVTFDDVHESTYVYAYPVLKRLGIPATGFLATAYLGQQNPFPFDCWGQRFADRVPPEMYRPVSVEQCREMMAEGLFEFGYHTHTHQDFSGRPEEFREDLRLCVDFMKEHLEAEPPLAFSHPYGSRRTGVCSPDMLEVIRSQNLLCALTTDPHLNAVDSDPMSWGRFEVFRWDTSAAIQARLAGWYEWAPRLAGKIRRRRGLSAVHSESNSPTTGGRDLKKEETVVGS